MPRIVGIDFGLKRIGVALSDERGKIALPLGTVAGGPKAVFHVLQLLKPHLILAVVIGLPLLLSGKKGDMAIKAEKFGQALGQALDAPLVWMDERLSSLAADRSLKEISLNRKQRNAKIDVTVATMMLQSYLDQKHI